MEISELLEQEDLQQILTGTLSRNWTMQYGTQVKVHPPEESAGQPWHVRDLLSTYFTSEVSKEGRRFMADRFRFTPVKRRAPLQWLLGTVLTSKPLVRTSALAFRVDPPMENSSNLLIVPGSRRIRIFDFGSGVARSVIKEGFNTTPIENEVEVRSQGEGPFPKLARHDPDGTWFEEPIIDGYPLPRVPPWWNREGLEQEAFGALAKWSQEDARPTDAGKYLEELHRTVVLAFKRINERFPDQSPVLQMTLIEDLVTLAGGFGSVPVSQTHGDFQPGNIQVPHDHRTVHILDWEFAGRRFLYYDLLTYGLHLRYPAGFEKRAMNFLTSGDAGPTTAFLPEVDSTVWRRRAFAFLALEELARAGGDAATAPYIRPPTSLVKFCKTLPFLVGRLKG